MATAQSAHCRPRHGVRPDDEGGRSGAASGSDSKRRHDQRNGAGGRDRGCANLIHGARAVLPGILAQDTPLGRWARGLSGRVHRNIVVVALAAKVARIVWAVLRRGQPFDPAAAATLERVSRRRAGSGSRLCLRVVKGRWPDSRTAAAKLEAIECLRGRCDYEDDAARISILAGA